MDYLELADSLIRNVGGNLPPDETTAASTMSIAAALIAIAERRPQVVQVGSYAIRADAIAVIYHGSDSTTIFSETGTVLATLSGKELATFLNWWNEYADVVRLEVGG